jgi:hypothetical protein
MMVLPATSDEKMGIRGSFLVLHHFCRDAVYKLYLKELEILWAQASPK